jgi:alpha/beta superfamily hydrolase
MPTSNKTAYIALTLSFLLLANPTMASDREISICGSFKEPFLFWLWSSLTPSPSSRRVADLKHVKPISFMTSDNRTLVGYRYNAHDQAGNRIQARAYVLMALGNAMLADQVIGELGDIAASGYDVYIYDYRGYGRSEGKRRIKAILEDYREIAAKLNPAYGKRVFYGVSLGAVVVSNLIGTGMEYDAAILDSGPSRLSPFGCPDAIDPVANLPEDASRILVITGDRDTVLGEAMTGELRKLAGQRGARIVKDPHFAHPFMDSHTVQARRMTLIKDFIISMTKD